MKHMIFGLNLLILNGCLLGGYPTGKITIVITNENEEPIANHEVGVSWEILATSNPWDGTTYHDYSKRTDKTGLVTFSDSGLRNVYYGTKNNHGYYPSAGKYEFVRPINGKWQPWNPTVTLRVRKIENPIAMYTKSYDRLILPISEVGYDLIKGDLVSPYGKGEMTDCVFKAEIDRKGDIQKETGAFFEQNLTVTFPGDFNGIVAIPSDSIIPESDFKLPRYAPEYGYSDQTFQVYYRNEIVMKEEGGLTRQRDKQTKQRTPDAENFFFRIRSEKNPDGTFKSALYGKIHGPLGCKQNPLRKEGEAPKITITGFSFYINPTRNDLNMEYDATHNYNLSYPHEPSPSGWWIRKYGDYERPVREP